MDYKFLILIFAIGFTAITSCKDDDDMQAEDPQYSIAFNSPDNSDKNVNDNIHIHVDFISAIDATVHHVNVRIYNELDESQEIYNAPTGNHVHEESGKHEHHADLVLSEANGVMAHTDWVMEAKVWGHEAGAFEVMDTIHFHVHPE